MTLVDILKRELAETKHYYLFASDYPNPHYTICCKCGYHLIAVAHDHVSYRNRRGNAALHAADPHFFDKLRKLMTELHRRHGRERDAFDNKLHSQT
jgi:hypothetical protein